MSGDSAQSPSASATAFYNDSLAAPLGRVLDNTKKLLPLLKGLPDGLSAQTRGLVAARSGEEAFVAPDTVSTLPSLTRSLQGLEGFFATLAGHKQGLNEVESAAATLRWEPFDQFRSSVAVLHDALAAADPQKNADMIALTGEILQDSRAIAQVLGGEERDKLFSGALADLRGQGAVSQQTSYDAHIARPMHAALDAAGELTTLLAQLPVAEQERINARLAVYAQHCTLEDMNLGTFAELPERTNNLRALDGVLQALKTGAPANEAQSAALKNAWGVSNDLRSPVRALHAILNADNVTQDGRPFTAETIAEPGRYDRMLELAAAVTGNCFEMQRAFNRGLHLAPPTKLADVTATPVNQPGKDHGVS